MLERTLPQNPQICAYAYLKANSRFKEMFESVICCVDAGGKGGIAASVSGNLAANMHTPWPCKTHGCVVVQLARTHKHVFKKFSTCTFRKGCLRMAMNLIHKVGILFFAWAQCVTPGFSMTGLWTSSLLVLGLGCY